jgi:hypothetical protein
MLDLSNITSQQQQTYTFYATGNWQTWNKPRNAKFIEIFCLGGGGGGATGSSNTGNASGGNGGTASGYVRGLIPAFLLPDTLYILVGKGGLGSTTNISNGTGGGISYVGLQPSTSEQTLICKSMTNVSTTNAPTVSVVSLSAFGNLGLFTAIAGLGFVGAGANTTALASSLVTSGAGGGSKTSTTFNTGGNILPASAILTSQVNGGQLSGGNGDSGYGTLQPFCGTGGAGGAGRLGTTGQGGNGGDGWYGCGGGGAGANSNNPTSTSGKGGNGGDGLVIITVIC